MAVKKNKKKHTRAIRKITGNFQQQVKAALKQIEPTLGFHGGGLKLISVNAKTGVVTVRFLGSCVGCAMLSLTANAIEKFLKKKVKGLKAVRQV